MDLCVYFNKHICQAYQYVKPMHINNTKHQAINSGFLSVEEFW